MRVWHLVCLLLLCSWTGHAAQSGDSTCEVTQSTITITKYAGPGGDITMPATIDVEVFGTGNEQSVIERCAVKTSTPVGGRFSNSLDHAFAVLLAKAQPAPTAMRIAEATVGALCDEGERLTHGKVTAAQRTAWVEDVTHSGSFAAILKELAVPASNSEQLVKAGLNSMLQALGWNGACVLSRAQADEFKKLLRGRQSASEERGAVGVKLDRWPVIDVVAGFPAAKAGLENGDLAVAINGQEVTGTTTATDAMKMLQGPPGGVVMIAVKRDGKTRAFEVTRTSAGALAVSAQAFGSQVLLVRISTFEGSGIAEAVKRLIQYEPKNQPSVVLLDLRDNGGGRPEEANAVADLFLDEGLLQICEFRDGRRIAFKCGPGRVDMRVIVLINRQTGSAAEMLAMALQTHSRATLVGERTAGALFGKDLAELTGGQTILFRTEPTVLAPDGRDYSATGIPPDVEIRDSRSKEKDEILARALELAKEGRP